MLVQVLVLVQALVLVHVLVHVLVRVQALVLVQVLVHVPRPRCRARPRVRARDSLATSMATTTTNIRRIPAPPVPLAAERIGPLCGRSSLWFQGHGRWCRVELAMAGSDVFDRRRHASRRRWGRGVAWTSATARNGAALSAYVVTSPRAFVVKASRA